MRSKIKKSVRLGTIAASVALAVAVSQPAFAAGGWLPIINVGSSLCLQPLPTQSQSINGNGVRIAQEPCTGNSQNPYTDPQLWVAIPEGATSDGTPYYYLYNKSSTKCMDVTDASTADHAPIQQFDCNLGGSEMWIMNKYDFGTTQYVNLRTSKCLDIPGASTSPTYIQQYHCTGSNVAQAYKSAP